jgi:hypothetical protein
LERDLTCMLCRCERVPDRGIDPGTAFTELQFYPPGRVKQFHGRRCDARDWCAALTIDSLSEDLVNGITLNPARQGEIRGGFEYVSFVFLTRSGTPIGPPNPLQFNSATSGGGPASRQACRTWHCRGRGVRRARGGSCGRARAAAGDAGPASNTDLPGTRC